MAGKCTNWGALLTLMIIRTAGKCTEFKLDESHAEFILESSFFVFSLSFFGLQHFAIVIQM